MKQTRFLSALLISCVWSIASLLLILIFGPAFSLQEVLWRLLYNFVFCTPLFFLLILIFPHVKARGTAIKKRFAYAFLFICVWNIVYLILSLTFGSALSPREITWKLIFNFILWTPVCLILSLLIPRQDYPSRSPTSDGDA
jgi:hypothetical protein